MSPFWRWNRELVHLFAHICTYYIYIWCKNQSRHSLSGDWFIVCVCFTWKSQYVSLVCSICMYDLYINLFSLCVVGVVWLCPVRGFEVWFVWFVGMSWECLYGMCFCHFVRTKVLKCSSFSCLSGKVFVCTLVLWCGEGLRVFS